MAILQSASGYGGLENSPLARPYYYREFIHRVWERDWIPEIVNSRIAAEITGCNQQVQITKAPYVGGWRTYQKNQEMVPNHVSTDALCLNICHAAYNAIKFDNQEVRELCERWDQFEEAFLDAVYQSYVEMQRRWVIAAMILEASPQNKGTRAGRNGLVNLGTQDAPLQVTPQNIPFRFAQLQQVLQEALHWRPGEMFVIVPVGLRAILVQSNFANALWAGSCVSCSMAIDGIWDQQLMGFNVIETVHLPYVVNEDNNTISYYIIAGNREAFAYVSDIVEGRIIQMQQTFGFQYQMLAVWGGKMLYPKAVAVAVWTFDFNQAAA